MATQDFNGTPEISPLQLARTLEAGDPLQVLDVRAPGRVAAGRIDLVPADRFHNIVGSQLVTLRSLRGTGIDSRLPVTVVCDHGHDSKTVAAHLNRLGCRATSLSGGVAAWMSLVLARELEPPPPLDRLIQFDRVGKGALGYLLVSTGQALIVDPPRDAEAYLLAAHDTGAEVVGVADTHVHADYISGAPTLARILGVPYYLHAADSAYPYDGTPGSLDFRPLEDGDTIRIGRLALRARHTPGHTEGSLSYLIGTAAALTGDFIFIRSVGRPDLAGKVSEWTTQLWESLEAVRRDWPRETIIYPAHYSSETERRDDRSVGAPLRQLLEENDAFQFPDRDAFARWVDNATAPFPPAYRQIKAVNVGLASVDEREAEELEVGRNECALGGR